MAPETQKILINIKLILQKSINLIDESLEQENRLDKNIAIIFNALQQIIHTLFLLKSSTSSK
jgi:hypothetical protein